MNPWLLPLVPALAFVIGLALGGRSRTAATVAGLAGTGGAFVLAVVAVLGAPWDAPSTVDLGTLDTGPVMVHGAALLDGLAAVTAVAVGLVALLVQAYSVEYMRGDPRYSSYTALISLFSAAMLLVVVADDMLVLIVGWEVMGLVSYLLIGHHWELEGSRAAAVKSFIVTRVGDVAMIIGVLVLGSSAGTFRISGLVAASYEPVTLAVGLVLILAGCFGKSAQFPLHTWLPDAMAGPTPISALIHAATMVAAGVYLVVRLYPLVLQSPVTLAVLAVSACVTLLGSGLVAFAEDDLKRVLAWSTVGQLAYMMGALAVGSREAAMFHLLAHAGFKALLFLASGVVLHSAGTVSMARLGGLRAQLPRTALLMGLGLAALAGLPPLAGFFSKESVLTAAEHAALGEVSGVATWLGWSVLVAGSLGVVLTAAYCTRLWLRCFAGEPRDAAAVAHAHEPGPWMSVPLWVLAVPTVGFGLVSYASVTHWTFGGDESLAPALPTTLMSLLALALGFGLVLLVFRRAPSLDPAVLVARRAYPTLAAAFRVDDGYDAVFVRPTRLLANLTVAVDVEGTAAADGTGATSTWLGARLRHWQDGNPQRYYTVGLGAIAVAGLVFLLVAGVTTTGGAS